jgi:MHS family alpha-ketoglutarate permease-like MFS transporter
MMSEGMSVGAKAKSSTADVKAGRTRTLVGGAIGHFIEWYDWAIYGFLAAIFASQMFPSADPTVSLIASFSAFAIGFIGRPIGALVLSPLADKYGRRTMLAATIIMAGIGSLIIAICPTFARIGILAPVIIVAARLLQGFSAGGEFQIAITFLNEHAATRNRAFAASPQLISIGLSVLAATAISSLTTKYFSPEQLESWGWRVPFLIGAAMSVFGLYLRTGLSETPSFEKIKDTRQVSLASILAALKSYPKPIFIVFVVQMNTVQYYLWMIFLPTYANLFGGLDRTSGFLGSLVASVVYCVAVPVFALMSDRIGRKPFLMGAALGFLLFTYPLLKMLAAPSLSFGTFTLVAVVGALFVALNNSVLGTVFAELFPTNVRTSGIGIPYALCGAIFGGTAPVAATWLQQIGGPLLIALYVMLISLISLATYIGLTPETRGKSLD